MGIVCQEANNANMATTYRWPLLSTPHALPQVVLAQPCAAAAVLSIDPPACLRTKVECEQHCENRNGDEIQPTVHHECLGLGCQQCCCVLLPKYWGLSSCWKLWLLFRFMALGKDGLRLL